MTGRRLKDLLAADLRKELERRNLDFTGTKQVMVERLKEALKEEGVDIEKWRFERSPSKEDVPSEETQDNSISEAVSETMNELQQSAAEIQEPITEKTTEEETMDGKTEIVSTENVEEKNSRPGSPDCQLIVGVADGTSELDRELLEFRKDESKENSDVFQSSKESCEVTASTENKTTEAPPKGANNVWVNNIAPTTKAINLKGLFSKYGTVLVARIVKKSYPGGSKLCGFVTMSNFEEADKAICGLHKRTIDDHVIFCVRGDNKRTEEILTKRKLPHKLDLVKQPSSFLARKTASPSKSTAEPKETRLLEVSSSTRKEFSSSSLSQISFIERKAQMLKSLERRVRRKELEVKHAESKLKELERANHIKSKELEVEREVLRDARNRFARERLDFERRNDAKIAELRAYEQRLVRAETELRAAQEQQQRYYETERLRQQRLAYEEEMKKRQENRRRREKSLSPRHRREESPKRSYRRQDREGSARYWPSTEAGVNFSESNRMCRLPSRPMEGTPPRKLKKSAADYRGGRYEAPATERPDDADTDLRPAEVNRFSQSSNSDYQWHQQSSPNYRSGQFSGGRMKQSEGGQQQIPPPARRPMPAVPRFDAYAMMMNEMAAFAARAGGAALSAFNPRYSSNPYMGSQQPPPQPQSMDRQRFG